MIIIAVLAVSYFALVIMFWPLLGLITQPDLVLRLAIALVTFFQYKVKIDTKKYSSLLAINKIIKTAIFILYTLGSGPIKFNDSQD